MGGRETPHFPARKRFIFIGARDIAPGETMSSHHQSGKRGLIWSAVLAAFILLLPLTAKSGEAALPETLRFSSPAAHLLKGLLGDYQAPEMEPVKEYGAFFGLNITLKIQGGWNTFGGGDIKKGVEGMYDNSVASFTAAGVPIIGNTRASNQGGLEVGGDLIYAVTPRLGIGVGIAGMSAWKESHFLYDNAPLKEGSFRVRPRAKVSVLRAGLFYSLPFAGILAVSVRGGPALYSAKYSCFLGCTDGFVREGLVHTSYSQEAGAKKWGFEGGLGLDLTPNPFVAIFVEVQGRRAKFQELEGDETAAFFQGGQFRESADSGVAFIVETAASPELDIIPSGVEVPANALKATLDFSGFSYLAGLKFRF